MSEEEPPFVDLHIKDEDKQQHEIAYLQDRLKNLSVFKKMFFTLQEDLVEERRKYTALEARLNDTSENNLENIDKQDQTEVLSDATEMSAEDSELTVERTDLEKLQNDYDSLAQLNKLLMSAADEYLSVIDFYSEGSELDNCQDLISLLFSLTANFRCEVSAEVRCEEGDFLFFFNESLQGDHTSFLRRLKIRGRLVEENNVICINFSHVSLLVEGLSKEDERQYLRVKEILVLLASSTNNIIIALDVNKKLQTERKNLYKIVKGTQKTIEKVEHDIDNQLQETSAAQLAFITSVSDAFDKMNMSIEDKKILNALLNSGKQNVAKNLKNPFVLNASFLDIIAKLEKSYAVVDFQEQQVEPDD